MVIGLAYGLTGCASETPKTKPPGSAIPVTGKTRVQWDLFRVVREIKPGPVSPKLCEAVVEQLIDPAGTPRRFSNPFTVIMAGPCPLPDSLFQGKVKYEDLPPQGEMYLERRYFLNRRVPE